MKKILLLAFLLSFSGIFAQKSNLIFFAEQGEKFSVILNGVLQNSKPATNVKVIDLTAPSYKLKIIFQDSTLPQIDKNLMFHAGTETTFNIKKNNSGEYVVRFLNEIPIDQALPSLPEQTVIVFAMNNPSISSNITTTTTTATTTTDIYSQVTPVQNLPEYSGPVGCLAPMSPTDFESLKNSISSKSFEEGKLDIAKQAVSANCLLCSQVREVMKLFSFEDTKLTFAKFAYVHTYDTGNYFKVNDTFSFESSIDELNTYISGILK